MMNIFKQKLIYILFVLLSFQLYSDSKEEELVKRYSYIEFPDTERIYLRYSTIDEIIKKVGEPVEKIYHETGNDEFFWDDYWTYKFEDKNLIVSFYSSTREIIAIYANFRKLKDYHFPFNITTRSKRDEIFNEIKNCGDILHFNEYGNSLTYYVLEPEDYWLSGLISYGRSSNPQFSTMYDVSWYQNENDSNK